VLDEVPLSIKPVVRRPEMMQISLPMGIVKNPVLHQWLSFETQHTITLHSGKVELGQGVEIALQQIACDALGVDPDQLQFEGGNTLHGPDEGHTAGSQSIDQGGHAVRMACLFARQIFYQSAADELGVAPDLIELERGIFSSKGSDKSCTYWSLLHRVNLMQPISPSMQTAPSRWVGLSVKRPDFVQKLSGAGFIHDFSLPGMLHARMIRGPIGESTIDFVDLPAIGRLAGIQHVIHSKDFLAVVGPKEDELVKATDKARAFVRFSLKSPLPIASETEALLTSLAGESKTVHQTGERQAVSLSHEARYSRPYIAHGSIGPSCALAQWVSGQMKVWSHTQGVFPLRSDLAKAFHLTLDAVQVFHMHGSGCYGHNGADDVAFDAAFISFKLGVPIRMLWMREDEMTASPLGAPSLVNIRAGVDSAGRISEWHLSVWSHSHLTRPGGAGVNLLGAWQVEGGSDKPSPSDLPLPAGGGHRNAVAFYDFAHQQVDYGFIPDSTLRTSALRSLGSYVNLFAIESFMDEMAEKASVDALDFRLQHLSDSRAVAVLTKLGAVCGWGHQGEADGLHGLGLGFGRYKNLSGYCAVAALIRVDEKITVEKIWAVVDVGLVVNPDGLINQIEGGIVQSLSWTLKEQVTWDSEGITSRTWAEYPIISFSETPEVEVHVIDRPDCLSLGSGEVAAGPVAAAIGNALYRAIGIRARHLPLTPGRLTQMILTSQ
jgi:CO/xanthine dehydrogenase Mo-binding subunit